MTVARLLLAFGLVSICHLAQAQAVDGQYSLALRFSSLIAQQKLSSPPLSSLSTSEKHKFSVQAAYIEGNIDGSYNVTASDGTVSPFQVYAGKSIAYSGGLAYRSPAVGQFSLFAFSLFTGGSANFAIPISSVHFQNSKLRSMAGAVGSNYVFLGDDASLFRMGLFAGMYASNISASYDYSIDEGHYTPGTPHVFPVRGETTDFGPMAGIQSEFVVWEFALRAFYMHAWDVTGRCVDISFNNSIQDCMTRINSTFSSYGLSLDVWKFGITFYSHVWSEINNADIKFKKYQLSYTASF